MQNLQSLRQRIRSVQNTQKITRAMQMVAGAKLRRSQGELMSFRPYADRLDAMTNRFLAAHPSLQHPLMVPGTEGTDTGYEMPGTEKEIPVGLILVTSDTGLCGTYNERVWTLAEKFLLEHPSAQVVSIGRKGNRMLVRRGIPRIKEILDWGGRYEPSKAQAVTRWMQGLFLEGKISAWWIAYTQFISALRFKATVERFLPLERSAGAEAPEPMITEPTREAVSEVLLERFMEARFARILLEAFTAEHSARMMAMKNATDNAAEMIEHLTLVRNKVRQAGITKELIEVVSGSEALR